jgi:hypothetical protein
MHEQIKTQVTRWAREGMPFEVLEERINEMHELMDDERSALWLLAWSYQPAGRQRDVARQSIQMLEARRRDGIPGTVD